MKLPREMSSNALKSRFVLLVVAGWIFYALFFGVQSYISGRYSGREVWLVGSMVGWFICALIWMAATPIALKIAQRFPFERGRLKVSIPVHLVAGVIFSVTTLGIYSLVSLKLSRIPVSFFETWGNFLVTEFHFFLLVYFALIGLYQVYNYYSRFRAQESRAMQLEVAAAQLETQLANAQLDALKMQIHPHFLFNTLNSISALIQEDPAQAEKLVERLAALLRFSLDSNQQRTVPLEKEMKITRDYLEIERVRFGERLRYSIDLPAALEAIEAPPLAVQTLVENSVKHAIAPRREGGEVRITARLDNDNLCLEVADDGPGFARDALVAGHGLDTLHARLLALYHDRAALDITSRDGRTVVRILLPAARAQQTASV